MILVDTSVWIEHLRHGVPGLAARLEGTVVMGHPFVTGELACGTLADRPTVLQLLDALPQAPRASDAEVRALLDRRALYGRGIGWVDAHLIAAALLADASLWTRDRRLESVAESLGIAA